VLIVGAVHTQLIVETVCSVVDGRPGAPAAVDCASRVLLWPSNEPANAVTAKLYKRPACRLDAMIQRWFTVPTRLETVEVVVPSFRYTLYDVTDAPPDSTDAVQVTLMLVAVWPALDNPVGAAGAVDCVNTALETPWPALLSAATVNEYVNPPDSPVMSATRVCATPVPSYVIVDTGVLPPALRYTT
jgi:hypothetical protein